MQQQRPRGHYLLRAAILTGLALYTLYLMTNGLLSYYIVPRMEAYVVYSAIALLLLALFQCILAFRIKEQQEDECGCGAAHSAKSHTWTYVLFVIPLLLGVLLPDTIMGSDIVSVKGMNLSAGNHVGGSSAPTETASPNDSSKTPIAETPPPGEQTEQEKLEQMFPPEYGEEFALLARRFYKKELIEVKEEGFLEVLSAMDMYRHHFEGKQVRISGFVYKEPDMADNQFVVSRLALTCCSADASPYGLLVEASSIGKGLKKDEWVTVTGVIQLTHYNDVDIMKLVATGIKRIEAPATPYVYPYFYDFAQIE